MNREQSMVLTAVQLEGTDDLAVYVRITAMCETHGEHVINDEWRLLEMGGYEHFSDWVRDVMVGVAERY